MRLMIGWALVVVTSTAGAQRRDAEGTTIGRGKPAMCLVDEPRRERCTFYPRAGDGSFAIDAAAGRYYVNRVGPDTMQIDYDNGDRLVDQGTFRRSKDDRACWVQQPDRRICAW